MTIIVGMATVPSNSTAVAFRLPPGYCNSLVYQTTQAQAVFLGPTSAATSSNGVPVPITPAGMETYTGSAGAAVWATTGNATASSFYYLLSTTGSL